MVGPHNPPPPPAAAPPSPLSFQDHLRLSSGPGSAKQLADGDGGAEECGCKALTEAALQAMQAARNSTGFAWGLPSCHTPQCAQRMAQTVRAALKAPVRGCPALRGMQ